MIRSALMVAGDKIKHLQKIPKLRCDMAMINLEDGVYDKNKARELIVQTLQKLDNISCKTVVRINTLDSCGKEDIKAINDLKIDAIRIPKIRTIQDVELACKLIKDDKEIHLSIETKEAFENLSHLKINKRVTTVYLGILDLLESLDLPQSILTLDNPSIDYILSKFLIESKIAGFTPISFMFQDYKDTDTFTKWCQKEKMMGYTTKACLSPNQVEIVNTIFEIDPQVIQKAQYIKEQFELNKQKEITGFSDEKYGFIDEPIYKDALLTLSIYNKN